MAIAKVTVNLLDEPSYDVRIGLRLLSSVGEQIRRVNKATTAFVVTDSKVGPLYLGEVKASLAAAGYRVFEITVPAGEEAKTIDRAAEIWSVMAELKLSRDTLVVALGGGVVGDLAGFIAATYMRGVAVVQIPTTLLAMVDSSVGGKTGINLEQGKNLVGAFKQPIHVCASTSVLATLSEREWSCGCAEIAKAALVDSDTFFFWLTHAAPALAARKEGVVAEAITRAVVFKADVVGADKTESNGVRECLNYGHTLGHAIEMLAGYGVFSHGQAVAEGMRFAARLGAALVGTAPELIAAQDDLLDDLGLDSLDWSADPEALLAAMMGDKKVRGGKLRFVVLRDIGRWDVVEASPDLVLEHLGAWVRSKQPAV